jgi:hypothetical protein
VVTVLEFTERDIDRLAALARLFETFDDPLKALEVLRLYFETSRPRGAGHLSVLLGGLNDA